MTDSAFLITLLFIFLTALVGIFLRRRRRDRCLKDFEAFRVTVEFADGKLVWGRLAVFPNGLELFYPQPSRDESGHREHSFVLFADQMAKIQAMYRYHDELSPQHQAERKAEIDRTYNPSPIRQSARILRNLINTFADAFNQAFGAAVAQAKKGSQSTTLKTQDKQLTKIGSEVVGAVGNEYEPILERYIGRKVVVEERRGDTWTEHAGILKEYTAKWIELLDCRAQEEVAFDLSMAERLQVNRDLDFIVRPLPDGAFDLTVENHGDEEFLVLRVEGPDGYSRELGVLIPPGSSAGETITDLPPAALEGVDPASLPEKVELRADARRTVAVTPDDSPALPHLRLIVRAVREVDRCLPRSHSVLRHGGEPLERWFERRRRRRLGGP